MWTVLKKELREGWLFLMVNILWLAGVPPLMRLCIPSKWNDDATVIFYAFMFGFFVPLILVILAAGLIQDENSFLVRGLPVKPWRVAAGKLFYLALNFAVLEGLCAPYMLGPLVLPDWIEAEVMLLYLWMGATAVAALAAFAFASFLPRKSYAIFGSLLATILGMGSLLYLFTGYAPAIAADLSVQIFLGIVLLSLIVGALVLYHGLIRQAHRRWIPAAVVALLLPILAGVLWLRSPLWLKQIVAGSPYCLTPAGANLFIAANRWNGIQDTYLFDAETGNLKPFLFLGRNERVVGTDPARRVVFAGTDKLIVRDGKRFHRYSAIDPITGKTRDLGLLPFGEKHFSGDIVYWQMWRDPKVVETPFGFKNFALGTTYEYTVSGENSVLWGPDGVLFETTEAEGQAWKYVNYATGTPLEAFKGEYYPWPWSPEDGYFLYSGSRDVSEKIPYNRELFRWDPSAGALQQLGPGRPLLAQNNLAVLIRGTNDGPKTLVLYRDGEEVSSLPTDFLGGYPMALDTFGSVMAIRRISNPGQFLFWSDKDRKSLVLGILTIERDRLNLKTMPLPLSMDNVSPIPGSGDLLLFNKRKVSRFDPATGKKRRLV